jgi:hypothetical protein
MVPVKIIERWMPVLPLSQLRLVLYLLGTGHDCPPGLPESDRWKAAQATGLLPRSTYPALREMTESGLIIAEHHERALYYRLNLEWEP